MKSRMVERLSIDENTEPGGSRLTVSGRIDIESSPALRDRVLALLERGSCTALMIDLSAVPYIDTSGLATLVEALKIARASKTTLQLRLQDRPRYLLEVSGLLSLFEPPNEAEIGAAARTN